MDTKNKLAASAGRMARLVRILCEKHRRLKMRPAIRRLREMEDESMEDLELENDPEIRKQLMREAKTCHEAASWLMSDCHPNAEPIRSDD